MRLTRYVADRRVVVNLKSGTAVQGVIVKHTREWLAVKGVEIIEPGSSAPTPVDGEIVLYRVDVDYVQVP